jgi:signal peptidase
MRDHNKNNTALSTCAVSAQTRRQGQLRRALGVIANTALGALAIGMLVAALGPMAGWWHYEVIESGSMTPALKVGGVALVRSEPLSDVHVGQIIAFHPPGLKNYVRIHRVIAISRHSGQVWIRTKGDANNTADPGPVRLLGKDVYHETAFVPYAGYGAVWLYKHSTRVALTVVLFVLVVGGGLYLIWSGGEERQGMAPLEASGGGDPALPEELGNPATGHTPFPLLPRRLAMHHRAPVPDLCAEKAAEQAANASLLALNNIYNKGPNEAEEAARLMRLDASAASGPAVRGGPKNAS